MRSSINPKSGVHDAEGFAATDLIAKVLYERTYGRVWEDATQWARRDSVSCAESIVGALSQAHLLATREDKTTGDPARCGNPFLFNE